MAEMDTSSGGGHKGGKGVKKSKKLSTRVDLTPMVDLGFLLITFFIFATTLSSQKSVEFKIPNDEVNKEEQIKLSEQAAMTVLIGPDEKNVYFYTGVDPTAIKRYSMSQFREEILKHKKLLPTLVPPIHDSMANLSIKALPGSNHGTFISVYDEVEINGIKTYVKVKPDSNEVNVINAYNITNKFEPIPKNDEEAKALLKKKES